MASGSGPFAQAGAKTAQDLGLRRRAREPLPVAPLVPPWRDLTNVEFATSLPGFSKRTATRSEIYDAAKGVADRAPPAGLSIWTDGSAEQGRFDGGAGALVRGDGREEQLSAPAGAVCSSTHAELVALELGLRAACDRGREAARGWGTVNVFCDSQPALRSLEVGASRCLSARGRTVWSLLDQLLRFAPHLRICLWWLPSHATDGAGRPAVPENEVADALAAEGCRLGQSGVPLGYRPVRARLRASARQVWDEAADPRHPHTVALRPGRTVRPEERVAVRRPGYAPLGTPGLTRLGETELARFRSRHHWALFRRGGDSDAECRPRCGACGGRSSADHHLLRCAHRPAAWVAHALGKSLYHLLVARPAPTLRYLAEAGLSAHDARELVVDWPEYDVPSAG